MKEKHPVKEMNATQFGDKLQNEMKGIRTCLKALFMRDIRC